MPRNPELSFSNLRSWDGTQDRAFEELAFQLLKDDAPAGSTAIRTGSPDGGVEWYAALPNGTEWGWQAKHVRFDSLLGALRESVRRVARERKMTKRLTFVISINLATSTRGGEIKSQRDKYNDAVAAWTKGIPGAAGIEFVLVQGSDLLDRLSRPEHRGRRWFWWNDEVFTDEWLRRNLAIQVDAAHDRYRPDLQVDLPIQEDLSGLGFDDSLLQEVHHRIRRLQVALGRIKVATKGPRRIVKSLREVEAAGGRLAAAVAAIRLLPPYAESDLGRLRTDVRLFLDACSVAEQEELDLERKAERSHRGKSSSTRAAGRAPYRYAFRDAREAADRLQGWLNTSVGALLARRLYFLEGPAGAGKTHLLLDAAERALAVGRPAAVLTGGNFGRGDLWRSISEQLGLPDIGRDVLLGAMDAAGQASSKTGARFLLAIDALNDATDHNFWRLALPQLRAAIRQYPHVALAVSCRDTYVDLVDDASERSHWVTQTHPGFAGREIEATQRYFEAYGLEAPRIPLLMPEFTVPLFMRMYCEGLRDQTPRRAPDGHESRLAIFDRFLSVKVDQAARKMLGAATATGYLLDVERQRVQRVLDALLDEMAATGNEWVARWRGEAIAVAAAGSPDKASAVLGTLEAEGVLSREQHWASGGREAAFRILFQAFSDHLILGRRLTSVVEPETDARFKQWLAADASPGILEAAALILPERFGRELPDALRPKPNRWRKPSRGWSPHDWRTQQAFRAVMSTLPHRSAASVTERTVELLIETLPLVTSDALYETIVQCAPQPGHRLNAATLHQHLERMPLPRRDRDFGHATYHALDNVSSSWASLARWASRGPYPAYDPDVVELAAIPLVWLLSSPNRYMRDWITKALVQLLRGHLDVACRLLDRFWTIDDPYIVQRVVVICYAALLRAGAASEAGHALARRVVELVFAEPVRADELLLDSAQGVAEWAGARGLLTPAQASAASRPFPVAPPRRPPSATEVERRFGYRKGPGDSYNSLWLSVMWMGDFGRYVIESSMHDFTRFPIDLPYPPRPETRPRRAPRLSKRVQTMIAGLSTDELLEPIRTIPTEAAPRPKPSRNRFRAPYYPADVAKRWVLSRAVQLGWTPDLFAGSDRYLGQDYGRSAHKAERWGKKYQWMAFHELLSRIAANYHFHRWDPEDPGYRGLHALITRREIDPTVPPVEYRAFVDGAAPRGVEWGSSPVELASWPPRRLDFARYDGDVAAFVDDAETEPVIGDLVDIVDRTGETWVVVDGHMRQGDPAADESWRGLQQAVYVNTLLVPRLEASSLLRRVPRLRLSSQVDLVDTRGHVDCCWVREAGRSQRQCSHYHRDFAEVVVESRTYHVVDTVERVAWERGLLDCSMENGVGVVVPSSFVQQRASLLMHDDGPSWEADGERVIAFLGDPAEQNEALLVRRDWLLSFLARHDLELILLQQHERWEIRDWTHGRRNEDDPGVVVYSAGRLDKHGRLSVARAIRERR
jgi:hypothetical protein